MSAHRPVDSSGPLQRPPSRGHDTLGRRLHLRCGTRHCRALRHADNADVAALAPMGLKEGANVSGISLPRLLQMQRDRRRVALQFPNDIRGVL